MVSKTQYSYNSLIKQCFNSMLYISKPRREFIQLSLWLFLSIKGRLNFYQLERHSKYCEQYYRLNFQKQFDFLSFNQSLVRTHAGKDLALAFDPSYISKSGKSTEGIGKFWSGSASRVKHGLEIGGIAALDLENRTALHLEAIQTIPVTGESLMEFYVRIFKERYTSLLDTANILAVDAYFSKETFCTPLIDLGFNLVSRLRDDANLRYIIEPTKTGKKGRPKTRGSKIDISKPDMEYFQTEYQDDKQRILSAKVHSVALKRDIKVAFVQFDKTKEKYKIYFSSDILLSGKRIWEIYCQRFQIEFIYRDAKQHTGLNNAQARSKEKLNFHFNASLSTVNLAKIRTWYALPKQERRSFSMANAKTMAHNELLLNRFCELFAIKPNLLKNNQHVNELLLFGIRAA